MGMDGWWSMSSEVAGAEDMEAVQTFPFVPLFPSLLCPSFHLFLLDFGPVQMASARVFTTCQWRWSLPVPRIRRKVAFELYRSVVGLMGSYDCVRRVIVSFLVSLSFSSLIVAFVAQEVCA